MKRIALLASVFLIAMALCAFAGQGAVAGVGPPQLADQAGVSALVPAMTAPTVTNVQAAVPIPWERPDVMLMSLMFLAIAALYYVMFVVSRKGPYAIRASPARERRAEGIPPL